MTEQERTELMIAHAEMSAAISGLINHNAAAKRERDMVPAHMIVGLQTGLARVRTILSLPTEAAKPKAYRSMSRR